MKEEWKVYIKGVPNRGDEVIKALTKLGGKNGEYFKGDNDDYIYFINHKGNISSASLNSEPAKIIMDNYHEIYRDWDSEKKHLVKLKWKPGIGEMYWVVYANSNIVPYRWDNDSIDNNYFDFGNCFKTKEEAEAMAEKIKKLLKGEQL